MSFRSRWMVVIALVGLASAAVSQERSKGTARRVARPRFRPDETAKIFFEDVFAKVQGTRPANLGAGPSIAGSPPSTVAATPGSGGAPVPPTTSGWSKIISAQTIEDEVKAIKLEVDKNITTPSDFAGRGHKILRREFTLLAMLFAVIAEYDGEVRFKRDAAAMRDLFARLANNTKAGGNSNVFQEAKARKADLEDLLQGSSPAGAPAAGTFDWGVAVDRGPLMQRLELVVQERLTPFLANQAAFTKEVDAVGHSAELVGLLGAALTQANMTQADDEQYAKFAREMQTAAQDLAAAVKASSYDQARIAAGRIDKACADCHGEFR